MARDINLYAARLFGEHPIATWTLDGIDSNTSLQYFSDDFPAIVADGYTTGLPLVYGSSQSVGVTSDSTGIIIETEDRLWSQVKTYSNTGFVVNWKFWYDENITFQELLEEERFVIEFGEAGIEHNGYGMFTNGGKYNNYTYEFWTRINPRVDVPRKIWGTLTTLDGIWVKDNYITLAVGNKYKSFAIENWFRPMLLNVTYTSNQARLLINGQEVISLDLNPEEFNFDPINDEVTGEGLLGFMGYPEIDLFEVDCFSIFPYIVPDEVCKRRFVWGQGLSDAASFSTFFENSTTYIDWSFANYATSAIYPDVFNWDTGYISGLVTSRGYVKTPDYKLPEIFIQGRKLENLYKENLFNNSTETVSPGFSFKPEFDWTQNSYFYFDSIEKLESPPQIIYGVFSKHWYETSTDPQPLFRFVKRYTDDVIDIVIQGNDVHYMYNGDIKYSFPVQDDVPFTVGLDLNAIVKESVEFKNFLTSLADVEVFVGGDGESTFSGLIYRVGLSDTAMVAREQLVQYFPSGIANPYHNMATSKGTYVIRPFIRYGNFYLDIEAGGFWEDATPLSYFGRNFQKDDGTYESKLDLLQLNIGYDGLYKIRDNGYDVGGSEMKCYITFQPLEAKNNKLLREFTSTQSLPKNRVIDVSGMTAQDLAITKFEWINGTVVVPPQNYDSWKIVVHFDVYAEAVISSPFSVKQLSMSSQAYKDEAEVGTRFGNKLSSTDNFAIYKENTPYLYLTKDSGIEPLDGPVNAPVNPNGNFPYLVGNLNMFIKPNILMDTSNTLFSIVSRNGIMDMKHNGTGWVLRRNDLPIEYVTLYQNGEEVTEFTFDVDKWTMVGIEFGEPLDFSVSTLYKIILNEGAVYQNISVSALSETQVESTAIVRLWEGVRIQTWGDWVNDPSVETFADLVSSRAYLQYPVDPTQIYKIFTGGNTTSVGSEDPPLKVGEMNTTMATGVEWQTFDRRPS